MKNLLKKYSDQNPEKFNKNFILSRSKQDILKYVTDIFKSLEVLDEIKVESVTLDESEAELGPIKSQHRYYKPILPTRLNRIHYRIRITPQESVEDRPILSDDPEDIHEKPTLTGESYIKEGDIFINKLIDDCFFINEGIRYFLVYQIVDNDTYGTGNSVCLRSLMMPLTVSQFEAVSSPEYNEMPESLKYYEMLLFSKKVNPLLYTLAKDSYNSLVKKTAGNNDDSKVITWQNHRDPTIIDKMNKFWGVDLKFSEKLEMEPDRIYFRICGAKKDATGSCYVSVAKDKLEKDTATRAVLGCILNMTSDNKKKKVTFSYDELISPWFWIDTLSKFFTKNADPIRKFEKVKTVLISLARIIDDPTRNILQIADEHKKSTLTIIRYIVTNFDKLHDQDSRDLDNKRLRLFEYQLFPLRKYFSDHIYRILNSPTHSKVVLDRIFTSLNPMKIIKETITSEMLRYYNSSNEIDLYSSLLRCSFKGPQALGKAINVNQRDLHPSFTGRISLIASPAGSPGLASIICPFVEVRDDYYFK